MAGKSRPPLISNGGLKREARYGVNAVVGSQGSGGTIASGVIGLFNGVSVDEWNTPNVMYWSDASCYIDITVEEDFNIWRSGTTSWKTYTTSLKVEKWNGASWDAITVNQTVTQITNGQWEKTISGLTAGRYKFSWVSSRLDSEWYIEGANQPSILNFKTNFNDMVVGDAIVCRYTVLTSGKIGFFSEFGTCVAPEIPVTGTATPDGLLCLIKTNKGFLIADRVVQTNISFDVLNAGKMIEGCLHTKAPNLCTDSSKGISNGNWAGYPITNAFDNNPTSVFGSAHTYGGIANVDWLGYDFGVGNGKVVNYIELAQGAVISTAGVVSFQGSNDLSTWTPIQSCNLMLSTDEYNRIRINNSTSYRAYRILVTNEGVIPANTTVWTVRDFKMYNSTEKDFMLIRSISGGSSYADCGVKRIVSLLIHGEGSDGSPVIIDSSPNPKTITKYGSAQLKTSVKKFGSASIYFGGNADFLITPDDIDFNFGSEDFTVDLWAYPTELVNNGELIGKSAISSYSPFKITQWNGNWVLLLSRDGASWASEASGTMTTTLGTVDLNTWQHLSLNRKGNTIYLEKNGVITKSFAFSGALWKNTDPVYIGKLNYSSPAYFKGYMDEIRVVKYKAEYTSNFTLPTQPYSENNAHIGLFSSLTDKGLGAYPDLNEWDKYVVSSNLENKIIAGDDNVWNWSNKQSWTKDIPNNGCKDAGGTVTAGATHRVTRGISDAYGGLKRFNIGVSTLVDASIGFRPVLEYIDPLNTKSKDIFK
jgi:hypothetical protein